MKIQSPPYSIRLNDTDLACLRELTHQLQCSRAGAIHLLMRESLKALQDTPTDIPSSPDQVSERDDAR